MRPINESPVETDGIVYCIAGVSKIPEKQKQWMFHVFPPYLFRPNYFREAKQVRETVKNDKITGIFVGGSSSVVEGFDRKIVEWSSDLANFLVKSVKDVRENFSLLLFQRQKEYYSVPTLRFTYYPPSSQKFPDTYFISREKFIVGNPRHAFDDIPWTPENIRDSFGLVSIRPEDDVFIGLNSKTTVSPDEITTGLDLLEDDYFDPKKIKRYVH